MTSDTDRSRAFYTEVFGWTAEEPAEEFGGYFTFRKGDVQVAGCMAAQPGAGMPDTWAVYLATDDAAKTLDTAVAEGGRLLVQAMAVADLGTMGVVADTGGAAIGLWQPGSFPGFRLVGEAGTPSWFELHTRDYQGAVAFYRNVFRWDTQALSDTADFRYTVQRHGDTQLAGILDASGFLPDGVPAHWKVYFGVDDTDATLAKLVELGGSVVRPAEDTPYGRIAEVTDPVGAQFKLVAPNEAMPARDASA